MSNEKNQQVAKWAIFASMYPIDRKNAIFFNLPRDIPK